MNPGTQQKGDRFTFSPSWKVEDMRENKNGERLLVHTRMATAPDIAPLVDPEVQKPSVETSGQRDARTALAANRPQVRYSNLNDLMKIGGIGSGTQSAYQLGPHAIGLSDGTDAIYDRT